MKEQFVTFEIALKLKELGFNDPCIAYYVVTKDKFIYNINKVLNYSTGKGNFLGEKCYSAPLWQQVIDFLWNKYHIVITRNPDSVYNFNSWILRNDTNTYTIEQAILKAIELIKNK